jgi:LacI family transcriptional regulator
MFAIPALSSVRIPMERMGELAVQRLASRIADRASPPTSTLLPTEWISRGSTAHAAICTTPRPTPGTMP